jgi:hypothetical protein
MSKNISRREFLKLGGLSLGTMAFTPFVPREDVQDYGDIARVTIREVDVYGEPRDGAQIVGKRYRDQLVQIYYELEPADAPAFYNKLWYRVWGGYIHSTYLQKVNINYNQPLDQVAEDGQLAEVTVPYSQSYTFSQNNGWQVEYRLYFETTHWITGVDQGPDGKAWYQLTDELQPWSYWVPANHLRPVSAEELAPISPDVPKGDKRIEVDLAMQTLTAYERDQLVSKHMGDGNLMQGDFNLDAYELVGVPWTMFFHRLDTGYALHGTYWHNNFGWQMSHGCVNLRNADAKWLFRWSTPPNYPAEVEKNGFGTQVYLY